VDGARYPTAAWTASSTRRNRAAIPSRTTGTTSLCNPPPAPIAPITFRATRASRLTFASGGPKMRAALVAEGKLFNRFRKVVEVEVI